MLTKSILTPDSKLKRSINSKNIPSLHTLSRKALFNQKDPQKKVDLIKLAKQRNLNLNKKLSTNKIKQLLITYINLKVLKKNF